MSDFLQKLDQILRDRREADPDQSYVASLHQAGLNKILEKVGEECVETILAAKEAQTRDDRSQLVHETADLWFHCMVMLSHLDTDSAQVIAELERRFDVSGLEEKAMRQQHADQAPEQQ
jgi:phosphoribosyl-ATP pyrophosphohydrolase